MLGYSLNMQEAHSANAEWASVHLCEELVLERLPQCGGDIALAIVADDGNDGLASVLGTLSYFGCCVEDSSGGDTSQDAFFGSQTVNKPKLYNKDSANANAALSSRLPCVLAASRFAHYLKVMVRDKVGSFQNRNQIEAYLNNWIADYVLLNGDAPQATKARLPLGEARVDVTEVAGKPGAYQATVFLKPHFQMEELTASIRLVAALPTPAA